MGKFKHDPKLSKAENWERFKKWSDAKFAKVLEKYKDS